MRLDLSDRIQKQIYAGTFEPHETACFRQYLRPGMHVVDAGANVGYFTALATSLVAPTGRVVAVEPSPYAFARLADMVLRNSMSTVTTAQVGLGSESGRVTLYVPPDENHNHSPSMVANPQGRPVQVVIRTLDECAEEWNLGRIDLMKLDIEGYELEALRGARRLLEQRRIRAVMCEFNDYWLREAGTTPDELFGFLASAGFRCASGRPTFARHSVVNAFMVLTE